MRNPPVSSTSDERLNGGLRAFHVHPAFTGPLEIGSEIGAGVVEADLPQSWMSYADDQQSGRLEEMWIALCEWGETRGIDEVRVGTFSCSGADVLERQGFRIRSRNRIERALSRDLCGPAALVSNPERVKEALIALIDIPVLELRAFAGADLRMEVYDMSWDSMIAYAGERRDLGALPFSDV